MWLAHFLELLQVVLELAQQLFVGLEILPHIVGPNEYIKDLSGVVCDTLDLIWVLSKCVLCGCVMSPTLGIY